MKRRDRLNKLRRQQQDAKVQVPDASVPEPMWDFGVGPDGKINFITGKDPEDLLAETDTE